MEVVKLENISKTYTGKNKSIEVLTELSVDLKRGRLYAIMGHSGSGKSTIINIIGLLDCFDSGNYFLKGKNVMEMTLNERADLKRDNLGFVFQEFYLDEHLKAVENVILPMTINPKIEKSKRKERALALLEKLDLSNRVNHFPKELSGGEKQRVAIARALANDPDIILADEPTGDLDEDNEKKIFSILKDLSKEGKTVIVVSHSNEIKKYADIVYNLQDGKLNEVVK